MVEPSNLKTTLPGVYEFFNDTKFLSADLISGLVSGLLYTTFFALCPVMFKMIANAGSQATSVQEAEKYALSYYWYFMLITAFVFTVSEDHFSYRVGERGNAQSNICYVSLKKYIADAAMDIWNHR